MSITLAHIWSSNETQLRPILQSQGRPLSGDLGLDRATAAIIYHNAGLLAAADQHWVAYPAFATTMATVATLEIGLHQLQVPFVTKLLQLQAILRIACIHARVSAALDNPFPFTFSIRVAAAITAGHAALKAAQNAVAEAAGSDAPLISWDTDGIWGWSWAGIRLPISTAMHIPVIRAARDAPGTTPQSIANIIAHEIWHVILGFDAQIRSDMLPFEDKEYDPIVLLDTLLRADLSAMIPIARCFYLWSINEMMEVIPPSDALNTLFDAAVRKYSCEEIFRWVQVAIIVPDLSPITAGIHGGTSVGLKALIGDYVGRPPTHEEVISRLLAL